MNFESERIYKLLLLICKIISGEQMKKYLKHKCNSDDPELISVIDELPLLKVC